MIRRSLQRRDLEILRTIGRLRYVTTQDIVATFFATAHLGRRRLRHLSGLDLIATHRKGVPVRLPLYAWRLTARGLDAVSEAFPDELFPDGLAEHLADGNLHNLDHRDALSRLYLALLAGGTGPMPDDGDIASVQAVVDGLRARGTQFWWQPDGDVVLGFQRLGADAQIVPDATLSGRHRPSESSSSSTARRAGFPGSTRTSSGTRGFSVSPTRACSRTGDSRGSSTSCARRGGRRASPSTPPASSAAKPSGP
jgi:hypothetical protein